MAAGVDAIKAQLIRDFGAIEIHGGYDATTQEILLTFEADGGLPYSVRISREYDEDYAAGQLALDLSTLGTTLRDSASGAIRASRRA